MSYLRKIDNAGFRLEQKADLLRDELKHEQDEEKAEVLRCRIDRIMYRANKLFDEVLLEEQIRGYYR
ncbi:hypothetical protein [Halobacillus litoralis]|uniref:hypothetical protein n=1 Tax=Halobacillus litoralis TaxID=45668 RepID=UPI001CD21095|nr:hypothetical protein [Halobacillus litoralis]MCA1021503.1 hypothetical protein [Halobacillus litoralis]